MTFILATFAGILPILHVPKLVIILYSLIIFINSETELLLVRLETWKYLA